MKCTRAISCTKCDRRQECPSAVRRSKRARRPLAASASLSLLTRAAKAMRGRWVSVHGLAEMLYGALPASNDGRKKFMVRARRPINKMMQMGLLAMRFVNSRNGYVREYRLLPEGEEVLC